MTAEYLVVEIPPEHIKSLADAEQVAEEMKEVTHTKYGVYVLLSEFHPTKERAQ